jgi:hypothetical protein
MLERLFKKFKVIIIIESRLLSKKRKVANNTRAEDF